MKIDNPSKQLWLSVVIMVAISIVGTTGYSIIEGWSVLESFYMTVITLTTIGFGEVHDLSVHGRIFTIFLVIVGMSVVVYAAQSLTRLIVEGQILKLFGRRKMEREVKRMKSHFILCGFGRTGRQICEELRKGKVPYVVIERDEKVLIELAEFRINAVQGEATDDEVLIRAGVKTADTLITAVDSPADNVFITLTARGLNPDLHIVARAESSDTEKKLYRAGANKVVLPHAIGGRQMAMAAMRPGIVKFLDLDLLRDEYGVELEEIEIPPDSPLTGITLQQAALSQKFGLVAIGIIKQSGSMIFNPGSQTHLESGDKLILFGSLDQLKHLENLIWDDL
ncbi:potassium channel protein [bacterium]|nr:potassium channel protein [candidate division CSSED10-310 bacterium]